MSSLIIFYEVKSIFRAILRYPSGETTSTADTSFRIFNRSKTYWIWPVFLGYSILGFLQKVLLKKPVFRQIPPKPRISQISFPKLRKNGVTPPPAINWSGSRNGAFRSVWTQYLRFSEIAISGPLRHPSAEATSTADTSCRMFNRYKTDWMWPGFLRYSILGFLQKVLLKKPLLSYNTPKTIYLVI